jgi:tRNA (guanine37-N1)-methyltransferase
MLGIKVEIRQAEEVKKYLLDKKLYSKEYRPKKSNNKISFPLIKKEDHLLKTFKAKFEEAVFEKVKEKSYKDLLQGFNNAELQLLPSSYDIVGDIIIIELTDELISKEKQIADALLKIHSNIKVILKKKGIHEGEYRTQTLKHLAGDKKTITLYKENNASLKLDVAKVYFSPRLSTERKRTYKQVQKAEKILVMFSGIGVYPIVISKNTTAKKIVAIEKNPIAHKYAVQNVKLNKLKNIVLIKGDVRVIVPKLKEKFDRILMPLPKNAGTFLDLLRYIIKKGTVIHFYDFAHRDNMNEAEVKIKDFCKKSNIKCKILRTVKCGQFSPCKYRVCVDFKIVHVH